MRDYKEFLQSKKLVVTTVGKSINKDDIDPKLFDFQRDIVNWAVYKGRCAILTDTGTGKTGMGLSWSNLIDETTLIVAVLPAVAHQIVREARELWQLEVRYIRSSDQVTDDHKLYITNIDAMVTKKKGESIQHFDPGKFRAIWLDESSILKNLTGTQKNMMVEFAQTIPYRLCTTATPAPNDLLEIANHAEFLGIMDRFVMTSIFFTYNSNGKRAGEPGGTKGKGSEWVLKKHAVDKFYRWLASWAIACKKPSDLGYSDDGYELPPITYHVIEVGSEYTPAGMLPGFAPQVVSATELGAVKRQTIQARLDEAAKLINASEDQWLVWGKLNDETQALENALNDSLDVHGAIDPEKKSELFQQWINGDYKVLISKSSIAGMGMNFQHCHKMLFFGLDYSWEQFYQSIRRIYRYGQTKPVDVYIIIGKQEHGVLDSVMYKGKEAEEMATHLIKASAVYSMEELAQKYHDEWRYATGEESGENWRMLLGDSAERMRDIEDESVDLSIYSPPFQDLFVYSATERDLGNSASREEFFEHYAYIIHENYRIQKPGTLCVVHIQDTRAFKNLDGYIGRKDLSGDIIEAYQEAGFTFWQRITINKNPQIQAIRLKAQDLLFATLKKDSSRLAGGMADYLLVFKKGGERDKPITPIINGEMNENDWIRDAHPVWNIEDDEPSQEDLAEIGRLIYETMRHKKINHPRATCWNDIRETDVLNVRGTKDPDSEKHVCPLQLPVIERVIKLWSNPGEVVFSAFAGIGSELYEAVRLGRYGLGCELKPEYFAVAVKNCHTATIRKGQKTLFEYASEQSE